MTRARWGVITAAAVACLLVAVLLGTNLVSNAWLLLVEPANHIPGESSIWDFSPTVINDGSSNYWIYGEDDSNFYYFTGHDDGYIAFSRSAAAHCAGFVATNHDTWCGA